MARSRLRSPRGQEKRDDHVPRVPPAGPLIHDPAEQAYQVYSHSLDHRGPNGVRLKQWHELAACERRAWRAAYTDLRISLLTGSSIPVTRPEPSQVSLVATDDIGYVSLAVDEEIILSEGTIAQLIDKLHDALSQIRNDQVPDGTLAAPSGDQGDQDD